MLVDLCVCVGVCLCECACCSDAVVWVLLQDDRLPGCSGPQDSKHHATLHVLDLPQTNLVGKTSTIIFLVPTLSI
uniref:Secreted protein n=1 Tax=Anguilla anguilla TaxID=7936 RepID=A0A0E9WDZ7_ANGAN